MNARQQTDFLRSCWMAKYRKEKTHQRSVQKIHWLSKTTLTACYVDVEKRENIAKRKNINKNLIVHVKWYKTIY